MKKKLFSAALIVTALFSFNASAQQPVKSAKESTEVTAQTKADKMIKQRKATVTVIVTRKSATEHLAVTAKGSVPTCSEALPLPLNSRHS